MKRLTKVLIFVAVALAAAVAGVIVREAASPTASADARGPASLLTARLPDTEGKTQGFEQWRGKIVVVNFWATWCVPCRKEIPELIRAQDELGGKGVQVVGIAIDRLDKVKPYAKEMAINYPVLMAEAEGVDLARVAGNRLGALPFTVVFDRNGNAVGTQLGLLERKRLDELVRPLL